MKNARGRIVYIGKAKNLRSRVRSYFGSANDSRPASIYLPFVVHDIDVIVTESEKDALVLENDLIKRYRPKFNIQLRDDKDFIFLKMNLKARWPRLEIARRPSADGSRLFGPYVSAQAARKTALITQRYFQLRSCTDHAFNLRKRPCLQFEMGRCLAPCTGEVDQIEYAENVRQAVLLLCGRHKTLLKKLELIMKSASDGMEYEKAALYRDRIKAVRTAIESRSMIRNPGISRDVIGFFTQDDRVEAAVVQIREGRMLVPLTYGFENTGIDAGELASSFIAQYYSIVEPPPEVVVSSDLEDTSALAGFLSGQRKKRVRLYSPPFRGERKKQASFAVNNAGHSWSRWKADLGRSETGMQLMARKLGMEKVPERIECLDISHLGASNTTAAISVMINGDIEKKLGRRFRIKGDTAGDDYAAMQEVLKRRFIRALNGDTGWEAPDLLVLDGGKGQLNTALAVLSELQITDTAVAAIAKARKDGKTEHGSDRVFIQGRKNPISVRGNSPLMPLAGLRDEAHRMAGRYQAKLGRKTTGSVLTDIKGVGPVIARRLLTAKGSLANIRTCTIEEISSVEGVGRKLAGIILSSLKDQ